MTGRTHLLASGILGAATSAKLGLHPIHILICMAGGLFPDTDHRHSYLGRYIPLWIVCKPHRENILHSLVGAIAFSLPLLVPSYMTFFFLGYMSHLLFDMMNVSGVPFWWPKKRMISIARIKAGGLGELLVTFVFYMIVMAVLSYW